MPLGALSNLHTDFEPKTYMSSNGWNGSWYSRRHPPKQPFYRSRKIQKLTSVSAENFYRIGGRLSDAGQLKR